MRRVRAGIIQGMSRPTEEEVRRFAEERGFVEFRVEVERMASLKHLFQITWKARLGDEEYGEYVDRVSTEVLERTRGDLLLHARESIRRVGIMKGMSHSIGTKKTGVPCYDKAADDEPLFVLRGSDPATPTAIRMWAMKAAEVGHREEKVQGALDHAREIEEWQAANPDRVKKPS